MTSIRFEPELSAGYRNPIEPEFTFGFTLVTHSSAPNLASSRGLADESWPAPSKLQESRVQGFLASRTRSLRGIHKTMVLAFRSGDFVHDPTTAYDPTEPVVCLDEKPVTLHTGLRPTRTPTAARSRDWARNAATLISNSFQDTC